MLLFTLFVTSANAAALYVNSSSSSPTSTLQTMTVTGMTGPSPYSDPYFRNPFDMLLLDTIPVANGTDPRNLSDPIVSQYQADYILCSTLWDSAVSVWAKTAVYSPTAATITKRAVTTTSAAVLPTSAANASQVAGEDGLADPKTYTQLLSGGERVFTWTASQPCCKGCFVHGGSVDVFYWPTATQNPPVTTLVDSKGFTL